MPCKKLTCRHKGPQTLTGIETYTAVLKDKPSASHKGPQTLTGIETNPLPAPNPSMCCCVTKALKPLQGLKLDYGELGCHKGPQTLTGIETLLEAEKAAVVSMAAVTKALKPLQGLKRLSFSYDHLRL